MMLALLLYGYATGVYSSRRIARATYEDVAFRMLCGDAHPFFTTINEFRLRHRDAIGKLFVQVLRLCMKAGLVKLGLIALDGTKIRAAASKHRAMSHSRMLEQEARLKAEVEALLARAEQIDHEEDDEHGVGHDAEDIPAQLARRETRLERIRAAREALEREAAEARAQELRDHAEALKNKAADESVSPRERRWAATHADKELAEARALGGRDDDDEPPPGAAARRVRAGVQRTSRRRRGASDHPGPRGLDDVHDSARRQRRRHAQQQMHVIRPDMPLHDLDVVCLAHLPHEIP
ncbi:MAG: transposase [Micrococcales bacterium]|nr:transposase [Micrococcales bacterium]